MSHCVFCLEAKFEFVCPAKHIPGIDSCLVDAPSRNQLEAFHNPTPQARVDQISVLQGLVEGLMRDQPWMSAAWERWYSIISSTH